MATGQQLAETNYDGDGNYPVRVSPTRARRVYARAIVWARRVSPVRAAAFAPVRCRKRVVNVHFYGRIYDNVQKT